MINIINDKGLSQTKMLSEHGSKTGETLTKMLNVKTDGEIKGFKLLLAGVGSWKPCFLNINNLVTKNSRKFSLMNVLLTNPGRMEYILDYREKRKITNFIQPNDDTTLDMNDPNGGLIEQIEKKSKNNLDLGIIDLTCEQTLINNSPDNQIFGPDYPTKNVNYMNIIARCPSTCHSNIKPSYGVGIHPEISPICLSAIVDGAISMLGGIISISIFPGLEIYSTPKGFDRKL